MTVKGDYGGTWTLPRIVGSAKAREMYILNSKVTAEEALRIGLCSAPVFESPEACVPADYATCSSR